MVTCFYFCLAADKLGIKSGSMQKQLHYKILTIDTILRTNKNKYYVVF